MHLSKHWLLTAGLFFTLLITLPLPGTAQVSVGIRIGPPAPYRFAAPPPLVVIPGTYVYVIPDIDVDIFFFSGYWYRPHEGHWFRARSYSGPWIYCPDPRVPRALVELPPDYRRIPRWYRRIPHEEFRRNWGRWDRDRYWDRDRDWQEGWARGPEEKREERRGHFEDRTGEEHGRGFGRGEQGHRRD